MILLGLNSGVVDGNLTAVKEALLRANNGFIFSSVQL